MPTWGATKRRLFTTRTCAKASKRGISIEAACLTVLGPDPVGKSYALTAVDCPGHNSFLDDAVVAL